MSDEELFERIKQGDGDALSELYDRYIQKVASISRRFVRDQQILEEIVQDVFTRIWTTKAFTPDKGQFSHWISVVARRIAIDHVRKHIRNATPSEQLITDGTTDTMDNELRQHWLNDDLKRSMSKLREEERIIIDLAYFGGHTLSEISSILGVPLGTVKTRLHKALKRMKSAMADWTLEA